ncbi:Non-classical phosphatidylinositol transfer protein (PITP) [Cladophialophora chaetospira]|uniref:Phosphatidylinositol transfer protein SFH5 n=1 Tax=Cladophialophora chaetospira TaxID=386627 RepID=A0AA38XEU3_9EURO|nr:Non-classical phosphatidylinositol transfer protein (PITP) [Cladophialophora chaetospira]
MSNAETSPAVANNTVAQGEVSSVDPASRGTTGAPNNTTLPGEVSTAIPESDEEDSPAEPLAEPPAVAETKAEEKKDVPIAKATTPIQELWALASSHGHPEIWGVTLADPASHVPSQIVLQKYINAYDGDLAKSKETLTKTLDWRAKTKPLDLLKKQFNSNKFARLGYTTVYGDAESTNPEVKEVFTWSIYGGVKDLNETFGNLQEFIEWRVALMEGALQALGIDKATKPITAEYDPYKILQVHDYKSISFLRQSPVVKAASTETIKVFAQNYPELLKEKFFVNVPAFMGFIYAFMKLFVAAKTIKKFHPMSNGANLAKEMANSSKVKGLGDLLPKEYGGKGAELSNIGKQTALAEETKAATAS